MYVGRKMTRPVITVHKDTPVMKARDLMKEKNVKQLPVVDDEGWMVGFLTDRDLKEAWASPATTLSVYELTYLLQKLKVEQVMKKDVITVTPDTTIERAAYIMHENVINSLPVLSNDGKLMGIITYADMMDVLLDGLGMGTDSKRLIVLVRDKVGVLAEVTGIPKDNGVNIFSLVTLPLDEFPGAFELVLRVDVSMGQAAMQSLKNAGYQVVEEYKEDLTPFLPAE
jgi:acetoin utilization protein AcuB